MPLAFDPLFQAAACRFDIEDLPAHITGIGTTPYWSISVYNRQGENIYSINDRTAIADQLDLVIATPLQMIELNKTKPAAAENSVLIEADMDEGFVVIRSFVPDAVLEGRNRFLPEKRQLHAAAINDAATGSNRCVVPRECYSSRGSCAVSRASSSTNPVTHAAPAT